eukprot:Skav209496  [mRNA]  locus=scaffold1892:324837:327283:+ [translate_table: standard]
MVPLDSDAEFGRPVHQSSMRPGCVDIPVHPVCQEAHGSTLPQAWEILVEAFHFSSYLNCYTAEFCGATRSGRRLLVVGLVAELMALRLLPLMQAPLHIAITGSVGLNIP